VDFASKSFIAVHLEEGADQAATSDALVAAWHELVGYLPFLALSVDMMEGNLLYQEELEASLVTGSAMFALLIALMGLYGFVEATVGKRVKEIGVRKVMGADGSSIVPLYRRFRRRC